MWERERVCVYVFVFFFRLYFCCYSGKLIWYMIWNPFSVLNQHNFHRKNFATTFYSFIRSFVLSFVAFHSVGCRKGDNEFVVGFVLWIALFFNFNFFIVSLPLFLRMCVGRLVGWSISCWAFAFHSQGIFFVRVSVSTYNRTDTTAKMKTIWKSHKPKMSSNIILKLRYYCP